VGFGVVEGDGTVKFDLGWNDSQRGNKMRGVYVSGIEVGC